MGTQTEIVKKLRKKQTDYMLALKKNQGNFDNTTTETRYFISSLTVDAQEAARAIRGHWMIESYYWHLDVNFREDGNHTLEKVSAFNLQGN